MAFINLSTTSFHGEKIRKEFVLSLCTIALFLTLTSHPQAQQLPTLPSIENMDVNILIEARPDGNCYVKVTAEGAALTIAEDLLDLPLTQGDLDINISSPSPTHLNVRVEVGVTLLGSALRELSPEIRTQLELMNRDMINFALSMFQGKYLWEILSAALGTLPEAKELPPELADLKIKEISCTKFSWSEPTLTAAFTLAISGAVFDNEELRAELPINIAANFSASATEATLGIELEGKKTGGNLRIKITTQRTTLVLDGVSELPKAGGQVRWNFSVPKISEIPNLENVVDELIEKNNVTLTLKVPEDATVSGLPLGYSQEGSAYTWLGEDVAGALKQVLTGAQVNITYSYTEPAAEFPWLAVGLLVAIVVTIALILALRMRK